MPSNPLDWLRGHEPAVRATMAAEVAEWWNMLEFPAVISVDEVAGLIGLDEVRFEEEGGLGIYYLDTGLSGKSYFAAWYGPDRDYQGCTQDSP